MSLVNFEVTLSDLQEILQTDPARGEQTKLVRNIGHPTDTILIHTIILAQVIKSSKNGTLGLTEEYLLTYNIIV